MTIKKYWARRLVVTCTMCLIPFSMMHAYAYWSSPDFMSVNSVTEFPIPKDIEYVNSEKVSFNTNDVDENDWVSEIEKWGWSKKAVDGGYIFEKAGRIIQVEIKDKQINIFEWHKAQ